MYYISEVNYEGVNQNQDIYADVNQIEISTEPPVENMSKEIKLEGWCGTTDGWATYAHGEYNTIDEAVKAVKEIFGTVREEDPNGVAFESMEPDLVKVFKPGKYAQMGYNETEEWAYAGFLHDITAFTTDELIQELVESYEHEANNQGYTLDSYLDVMMRDRRKELREELEDPE